MLEVCNLRAEYLKNPLGIDAKSPRLSWILKSDRKNVRQRNYHLVAALDEHFDELVWDSGVVASEDSVRVKYAGEKLLSGQRVFWKVTVTDGEEEATSKTAWFEMGLLDPQDWTARWIEPDQTDIDIEDYKPVYCLYNGVKTLAFRRNL